MNLLVLVTVIFGTVSAQWDPNFAKGRTTIVHLFEWRWNDIAVECENFLGPYGYGGVQVSPVNENALISNPFRPWYERYQPVSYNVTVTRSGTTEEFTAMVKRCNAVGVRIYVDSVINHMTSGYSGVGTGQSKFDGGKMEYPEYSAWDFNTNNGKCPSSDGSIKDYNNPTQVRNCELSGLKDLNHGKEYVRQHIANFLNTLIGYGVAGFRVDAAKHMWPADLENIFGRLKNLSTQHGFQEGTRPFIYQEVIEQNGESIRGSEYFHLGRVTEFKYGKKLGEILSGKNSLKWLKNWGQDWGMFPDDNALVFIDNHDNQRGHGGGGKVLTFRSPKWYKMATAFMLAHPYGVTRVMSSYLWGQWLEGGKDKNDWIGPPHNENGDTLSVVTYPNMTCGNGWVCEHRWRQTYSMVKFRNVANGEPLNDWWDNGSNQIAFCRGSKGFIAINGDNYPLNQILKTSLPAGKYCDVISGSKESAKCTGVTVTVDKDGTASVDISNDSGDPMLAIHIDSKL